MRVALYYHSMKLSLGIVIVSIAFTLSSISRGQVPNPSENPHSIFYKHKDLDDDDDDHPDTIGDDGNLVEVFYSSPPSTHIDDSSVPEPGWVEANYTVTSIKTNNREIQVPLIDVNLGYIMPLLKLKCQLKAEIPPVTIETNTAGTTQRIVGDSAIGSKCMVYDNEGRHLSFAVYPEFDWSENGTVKHFRIPLIGAKEWEQLALTANVGYNKGIGTANTFWDGGFGIGHRVSDRNAVFAGTYYDGEDKTKWIEVGFRRKFGNNNLNIGVSRTVGGTPYEGGAAGKSFSVGWQHNWKAFKWGNKP